MPENAGGTAIDYTVEELNVPTGYTSIVSDNGDGNLMITNSYTPATTSIDGTKHWNDNDDQDGIRPDSVTIKLLGNNVEVARQVVSEADNWNYSFNNLPVYADGTPITYTVTEDYVPGYSSTTDGYDVTNERTPDEVSISVFKSWLDSNNQDGKRPETVQVQLFADGTATGDVVTLTSTGGWTYTWTDLPENANGTAINYTVEELNVPAGYTSIVTDNNDGNLIITNSYTPATTSIDGTKHWNDNDDQDGIRPDSVTIKLFGNNVEVARQVVTEADNWNYSFTNLPVYADGAPITYTVTEDYVPGYSSTTDGYDVTNERTPDEVSISVFKSWLDSNNQDGARPESIEVQLMANGVAEGDIVTLTAADGWTYTWTGLPENANGTAIDYTVVEVNVPEGYTSIITDNNDGNLMITNSYTPATTSIDGTKVWDDADNQDGVRPETITVHLLADGVVQQTINVTEANQWQFTFDELPVFADGERIVYTITEDSVEGYSTLIDGFDITNTRTPDSTSVTLTKSWLDQNNAGGQRPESIVVQLLANGESVGDVVTISAEGNWTYTWSDLPQKSEGKDIVYSISEINLAEGYTSTINDANQGNILLTNSFDYQVTEISGEKIWLNDYNNQLGTRPESITVELLRDGQVVDTQVVLADASGNWLYSFDNLDQFNDDGHRYVYTVNEVGVPDYTTTIDGTTITNTYNVEHTVTITGDKIWEDNNDELGKRPESITVNLIVDGQIIESQAVTADNSGQWTYHFSDLPMYNEDGTEIQYTVNEVSVADYETTYEGDTIINKLIVEDPTDEDPEEGDPGDGDPTGGDPGGVTPTSPSSSELPPTGDRNISWLWGMGILMIGSFIIYGENRKQKKDEDSE